MGMNSLEQALLTKAALTERIRNQRHRLRGELKEVRPLFAAADQAAALLAELRRHAPLIGAAAGLVLVLRPRRSLAWARRGFVAWRTWQWLRSALRA